MARRKNTTGRDKVKARRKNTTGRDRVKARGRNTTGRDKVKANRGVSAVEASLNSKLGSVSATYVSQGSCPLDCPHLGKGCYAEYGNVGMQTRRLNQSGGSDPVKLAEAEAEAIDGLSGDKLLRLHVVGDCRTRLAARIVGAAAARYARRGNVPRHGRKVWTYTHAWRKVERADWGPGVSVLASCETVGDARKAMARGYAAAVVVARFERPAAYQVDGTTVIPCPNQTKGVTCRECGLCRDEERLLAGGLVIAFEAHGTGSGHVRKTLMSLPTV